MNMCSIWFSFVLTARKAGQSLWNISTIATNSEIRASFFCDNNGKNPASIIRIGPLNDFPTERIRSKNQFVAFEANTPTKKEKKLYLPANGQWLGWFCNNGPFSWNRYRCSSCRICRTTFCWPWWMPSSCSCTWESIEILLLKHTEEIERRPLHIMSGDPQSNHANRTCIVCSEQTYQGAHIAFV